MSSENEKKGNQKVREAMTLLKEASKEKEREFSERVHGLYHRAQETKDKAISKAKKKASEIDESVHKNPWPYIGGAAILGLLLGFFLRFRRKE